jgi:hypothetical protein
MSKVAFHQISTWANNYVWTGRRGHRLVRVCATADKIGWPALPGIPWKSIVCWWSVGTAVVPRSIDPRRIAWYGRMCSEPEQASRAIVVPAFPRSIMLDPPVPSRQYPQRCLKRYGVVTVPFGCATQGYVEGVGFLVPLPERRNRAHHSRFAMCPFCNSIFRFTWNDSSVHQSSVALMFLVRWTARLCGAHMLALTPGANMKSVNSAKLVQTTLTENACLMVNK